MAVGFGLVLALLVPGVLDFALANAGYPGLGVWVWVLGYGTVIVTAWALWMRGLEFEPEGELRP